MAHSSVLCARTCCQVTLSDSRVYEAEVKGKDREKDVAVLRLKGVPPQVAAQLTPVVLGSSSNLLVGQKVGGSRRRRGARKQVVAASGEPGGWFTPLSTPFRIRSYKHLCCRHCMLDLALYAGCSTHTRNKRQPLMSRLCRPATTTSTRTCRCSA